MIAMVAQTTLPAGPPAPQVVWSLLWPVLVLALGGVLLVTVTSLVPRLRGNGFPAAWTALTAVVAAGFLIPVWQRVNVSTASGKTAGVEGPQLLVAKALAVDSFTVFITGVICIAVFFAALLLDDYLRREGLDGPEWYVLLLMSAAGGVILASANDLILTFLGLEILSIAAYVMAALQLRRLDSQEAGFKYFILGALASAFFLYGIALVYGATGYTSLPSIAAAVGNGPGGLSPRTDSSLILAGMAMLLIGFAFKVSAFPFHWWTPDVYQGSPTPVVAYMASGVKVAAFAGMARVFFVGLGPYIDDWRPVVATLAVLTLVMGAVLALAQRNVKRMLAYSSINHAGFILVAVHSASSPGSASILGSQALLFYLLAYTLMVVGTFGVATVVGGPGDGNHDLDDYRGLSKRRPVLAGMMAVLLFSQAGVPFTSGFFAKFRVIAAAATDGSYVLAGVAMLSAVVSAVLYLRIVVSMFLVEAADELEPEPGADVDLSGGGGVATLVRTPVRAPAAAAVLAVGLAAAMTIVLGLLPNLGGGVLTDAARQLASVVSIP